MVQQLQPPSIEDELLYPESDGKPLADNTIQFRLITTIQGGLDALFQDREDVFVAGDLLWYPRKLSPQQVRNKEKPPQQAPDVMVVFGRPKEDRRSYRQWEEGDIAPQVAFEILSKSNKKKEMEDKFYFYQKHGIEEYYLYDPKKNRLQGWLRRGEKLEEIAMMEGWRSPRLGIKFSTSEENLQLFYPNGDRFASYVEIVEQRDRERLEKELEKQRANLAENECDRERLEKQQEKQRADRQQQRAILAEDERDRQQQRADRAESDLQALLKKLQKLDIDIDAL
ncbi:MAG: Uma2 family endonuclease [Cyanobacteria bacterium SBLK]|nr:Uma2 family endonuclease [Cyanobacteria bacterium SBLK]